MEIHDIVQEAEIKTIPQKNKCEKAKWLSEEALQIAEKRKDVKDEREKERCNHENKCPPKYGNIIHDSYKLKIISILVSRWTKYYLAIRNASSTHTLLNMDEAWKPYASWKKLDINEHILLDSVYIKVSRKTNQERQKVY